jgi:ribosomal protein S18 acetylase RimI-like enzyme
MEFTGQIIPAMIKDADELTEITKISKAHWNYSEEQLKQWESDLTITEKYISENRVFKFLKGEKIIAYYSLFPPVNQRIQLDNLFVLPEDIGKGIGNMLLNDAIKASAKSKCKEIWLEADPNAESFYLKNGFKIIGRKESSISGRFLPVMQKLID